MIPESNLKVLKAIFQELQNFSSAGNLDGFYPIFCDWVVREWEARPYYITEIANFGHDLTHFPYRTDYLLREKTKSYRDFINANNGQHYATSLPGQGTACETMEKNLYEFFHESMRLHALTFIEESFSELDADDFWNRIFCEDFENRSELLAAEEITVHFGFYGLAAEPYITPLIVRQEQKCCPFQDWKLRDFRVALDLLKLRGQASRDKPIKRDVKSRLSVVEALNRKAFKDISKEGFRA